MTDSVLLFVIGLFRLSLPTGSVLVGCMFLGICQFLLSYPVFLNIIVCGSPFISEVSVKACISLFS